MGDKKFEDEYDVIIIGTGLTESILAAACARAGQKVLHIDPNDYYGDLWTNFTFPRLLEWIDTMKGSGDTPPPSLPARNKPATANHAGLPETVQLEGSERFVQWTKSDPVLSNVEVNSYLFDEETAKKLTEQDEAQKPDKEEGDSDEDSDSDDETIYWTLERLKSGKTWGIDLVPRLLYAKGSMANLLVSSNVCRYVPFHCAERILCCLPGNDELVMVPCTRQDICNDTLTSLQEKRHLFRLIALIIDSQQNPDMIDVFEGYEDQPFIEFLRHKNFTPLLQHFVINSVAMCDPTTPTHEAMENVKKFITSSGVFGNTPFLFPFYGCGEIPQAFCRLCAVFGGTYCLKQPVKGVILEGGYVRKVLVENQAIKCKFLVTSLSNGPKNLLAIRHRSLISRAIFIADGSIKDNPQAESLLRFPGPFPIFVIEATSASFLTLPGTFIVNAWCDSFTGNAKKDLLPIARRLFRLEDGTEGGLTNEKPALLWCCFFNQTYVDCSNVCNSFKNMYVTSPPCNEMDYDSAIAEARQIFNEMYPEEVFLPRAPDYHEIVIEGVPNGRESA